MLLKAKLITSEQLDRALAHQKTSGGRIGSNLAKLGYISEEEVASFLSRQFGVPPADLSNIKIDPAVIKLVPAELADKHLLIPLSRAGSVLTVAMANPSDITAIDDVRFMTGYNVKPMVAPESSIRNALNRYYDTAGLARTLVRDFQQQEQPAPERDHGEINLAELYRATEDAPVIKLVNLILTDAIKKGASDIHLEPYEKGFRIRFRVDGVLYEVMSPPPSLHAAVSSRVKIMARLELDLRISTVPTLFGEKVVMRLLARSSLELDMAKLGFEPQALTAFEKAILSPYGMILVTGPTGSGKTTTLYSALTRLHSAATNIMTAEDPIEYNLTGINQAQVKPDIGLNFATLLRSFL